VHEGHTEKVRAGQSQPYMVARQHMKTGTLYFDTVDFQRASCQAITPFMT